MKAIDKGIKILESNGDWYIKSRFKLKLGKGLYNELGVPEILTAGKLYPLIWNGPSFFVYCDIVEKHDSYKNIRGTFNNASKLLAVVPSQHYLALRMKSHQGTYLNDFDLILHQH